MRFLISGVPLSLVILMVTLSVLPGRSSLDEGSDSGMQELPVDFPIFPKASQLRVRGVDADRMTRVWTTESTLLDVVRFYRSSLAERFILTEESSSRIMTRLYYSDPEGKLPPGEISITSDGRLTYITSLLANQAGPKAILIDQRVGEMEGHSSQPTQTRQRSNISETLIPSDSFRVESQSYESSGVKVQELRFQNRSSVIDVVSFYKSWCERAGFVELTERADPSQTILECKREDSVVVATVRGENSLTSVQLMLFAFPEGHP
jgi:hypothetical protein